MHFLKSKVDDFEDAIKLIDFTIDEFKTVNYLITNGPEINKLDLDFDESIVDFKTCFNDYLLSVYNINKLIINYWKEFKLQGQIINCASDVLYPSSKVTNHSIIKRTLVGLTRNLAIENAKNDIKVNMISHGWIKNSKILNEVMKNTNENEILAKIPMNKLGNEDDVYKAVEFLLANPDLYMTGQNIIIDGGLSFK
ncbi:unnamed protein product [Candida verbasci]|uniref:Uncharacterized protein n=1 Tax=Candida verbasci TaxID=1227364 RepID=A0A9W4TY12_9ASCO|nr:unnamed protein product [Candida verbasci]